MKEQMTIVDRIRALANKQEMSLPELEIKLGLGNGTISRWNKSSPNTAKISLVADFFHVSVDYLLGRETTEDALIDDLDENYIILSRNAKKLSPEARKQLLDIARVMFKEEFND